MKISTPSAVFLLAVGCGGTAGPPPTAPVERAPTLVEPVVEASTTGESAAATGEASDRTLTATEYETGGVPPCDRPWTPDDYRRAWMALGKLARGDRALLPRAGSARSGGVFVRMVSPENFASLRDVSATPEDRAAEADAYLAGIPRLMGLYLGDAGFGSEQVAFAALLLDLLAVAPGSSTNDSDSVAGAPSVDPYRARLRVVTAGVLAGALSMLGESARYEPAMRGLLAEKLALHWRALSATLPPEDRARLTDRMRILVAQEGDPSVRDSLRQLLSSGDAEVGAR